MNSAGRYGAIFSVFLLFHYLLLCGDVLVGSSPKFKNDRVGKAYVLVGDYFRHRWFDVIKVVDSYPLLFFGGGLFFWGGILFFLIT